MTLTLDCFCQIKLEQIKAIINLVGATQFHPSQRWLKESWPWQWMTCNNLRSDRAYRAMCSMNDQSTLKRRQTHKTYLRTRCFWTKSQGYHITICVIFKFQTEIFVKDWNTKCSENITRTNNEHFIKVLGTLELKVVTVGQFQENSSVGRNTCAI